ncbi:hypothetical protein F5144DRAFT_546716 [Chaetomium tenue]|uniref:Uncharacterized protein n=1 Tax=Chaetomium tenue TaxID=1854479 RepID=A0ACB7PEA2_9PEZI|nr:hypothetical protein F5144DRAFT_546716 [Chaetomium globosum]
MAPGKHAGLLLTWVLAKLRTLWRCLNRDTGSTGQPRHPSDLTYGPSFPDESRKPREIHRWAHAFCLRSTALVSQEASMVNLPMLAMTDGDGAISTTSYKYALHHRGRPLYLQDRRPVLLPKAGGAVSTSAVNGLRREGFWAAHLGIPKFLGEDRDLAGNQPRLKGTLSAGWLAKDSRLDRAQEQRAARGTSADKCARSFCQGTIVLNCRVSDIFETLPQTPAAVERTRSTRAVVVTPSEVQPQKKHVLLSLRLFSVSAITPRAPLSKTRHAKHQWVNKPILSLEQGLG